MLFSIINTRKARLVGTTVIGLDTTDDVGRKIIERSRRIIAEILLSVNKYLTVLLSVNLYLAFLCNLGSGYLLNEFICHGSFCSCHSTGIISHRVFRYGDQRGSTYYNGFTQLLVIEYQTERFQSD